jgi:polar amino acid transport system substrate-binding protein
MSTPTTRSMPRPSRTGFRRCALAMAVIAGGAACSSAPPAAVQAPVPPQVRDVLAPTGTLRIAVYPGSPTSMLPATAGTGQRGVAVDLGRALAQRLGVPAEIVVLPRVAEVVAALKAGRADFTVTNATPERAADVDFTPPLIALELGVLVPAGARLQAIEGWDQPGVRIGVSQGSSSERALAGRFSHARLVGVPTLAVAAQMLADGQLDAFASNKAILHELAGRVSGARVLDGRWGLERLAIAVPMGRDAGMPALRGFVDAAVADGSVARAAARAGLRGTAPADAR